MVTMRKLILVSVLALVLNPATSFAQHEEESMLMQARQHLDAKEYYFATTWLERFLKKFPADPHRKDALLMLSKAYLASDREEKAIKPLKTLLSEYPNVAATLEPKLLQLAKMQTPVAPAPTASEAPAPAPKKVATVTTRPAQVVTAAAPVTPAAAAPANAPVPAISYAATAAPAPAAAAAIAQTAGRAQATGTAQPAKAEAAQPVSKPAEAMTAPVAAPPAAKPAKSAPATERNKEYGDDLAQDARDTKEPEPVKVPVAPAPAPAPVVQVPQAPVAQVTAAPVAPVIAAPVTPVMAAPAVQPKATLQTRANPRPEPKQQVKATKQAAAKTEARPAAAKTLDSELLAANAAQPPATRKAPVPAKVAKLRDKAEPKQATPEKGSGIQYHAPMTENINLKVGQYTLKVGEYLAPGSMAEDKKKLADAGLAFVVVLGPKKKAPMIRLEVEGYSDQESAQAMLERLRNANGEGFIVSEKGKKYHLYAGSFVEQKRAEREQQRLASVGITTSLQKKFVELPVLVLTAGTFTTEEAAREKLKQLEKEGLHPVVVKISRMKVTTASR